MRRRRTGLHSQSSYEGDMGARLLGIGEVGSNGPRLEGERSGEMGSSGRSRAECHFLGIDF